jgi:hypothetical protein
MAESFKLLLCLQQLQKPLPQSSSNIVFDRIHSQARTCEETLQSFLAETSNLTALLDLLLRMGGIMEVGKRYNGHYGLQRQSYREIKPETRNAGY